MSYWYPFLEPHQTTHHSNIGLLIRKAAELGLSTPACKVWIQVQLISDRLWQTISYVFFCFSAEVGESTCKTNMELHRMPWATWLKRTSSYQLSSLRIVPRVLTFESWSMRRRGFHIFSWFRVLLLEYIGWISEARDRLRFVCCDPETLIDYHMVILTSCTHCLNFTSFRWLPDAVGAHLVWRSVCWWSDFVLNIVAGAVIGGHARNKLMHMQPWWVSLTFATFRVA